MKSKRRQHYQALRSAAYKQFRYKTRSRSKQLRVFFSYRNLMRGFASKKPFTLTYGGGESAKVTIE